MYSACLINAWFFSSEPDPIELRQQLRKACRAGDSDSVKDILSNWHLDGNYDLQRKVFLQTSRSEQPLLFTVCQKGHTGVVKAIFECLKSNVELFHELVQMKDGDNKTILNWVRGDRGRALFHWASRYNCVKIIEIIFEHLNTKKGDLIRNMVMMGDDNNETILHMACGYGHKDLTKVILEQVNDDTDLLTDLVLSKDNGGNTALHTANIFYHIDVINILFGCIKGHPIVVEKLIRCHNNAEMNTLHLACIQGFHDIVEVLFKYMDSNKHMVTEMAKLGDKDNRTPLYLACQYGHENVVEFLLRQFEANDDILQDLVTTKSKDGMTPIEVASKYGNFSCIATILDHNYVAKKNMLIKLDGSDEVTILLYACQHGHKNAVKSILAAANEVERREPGVDLLTKLFSTHIEGKRILHIACNRGDTDVVRMILDQIQKYCITKAAFFDAYQKHDSGENNDSESKSAESNADYDDAHDDDDDDEGSDEAHRLCHKDRKQSLPSPFVEQDDTKRTALHECCQHGDHHIVKMLLDAVPELDSTLMVELLCNQDDRKHTSLWNAFENGHYIIVKNILTEASKSKCVKKLLLECRNGNNQTIFHRACRHKYSNMRCLEAVVRIAQLYKDDNEDDNSNNGNNCKTTQTLIKELLLAKDRYDKTFIFYIAESNEDVMHLLIKTTTDTDWEQTHPESESICYKLLTHKDKSGKTALMYTNEAKKLFVLTDFLDPLYDKIKKNDSKNSKPRDFTLFHREIIDYGKHKKESLLTAIGDAKCLDLIQHDYTKGYLNISWTTHGRYFFFTNLFLYLMELLLLSTFVVTHKYEKVNGTSNTSSTDLVLTQKPSWLQPVVYPLVIFAALNFIYEILQMNTKRRHYWKAKHNYTDLTVCLVSLGLSLSVLFLDYGAWHHQIGTTVMCMAWLNAAWMMTKIPSFSKSSLPQKVILMFTMMFRVIGRVCLFIPVFATFTLTFALCIHTLIPVQIPFSNVGYSIIKIIGMTIGELDLGDIFFSGDATETPPFYVLSCVLFVVFLGIMTISAMNLLVGMAVGDINELSADSEVIAFKTLVDLTLESQAMFRKKPNEIKYKNIRRGILDLELGHP